MQTSQYPRLMRFRFPQHKLFLILVSVVSFFPTDPAFAISDALHLLIKREEMNFGTKSQIHSLSFASESSRNISQVRSIDCVSFNWFRIVNWFACQGLVDVLSCDWNCFVDFFVIEIDFFFLELALKSICYIELRLKSIILSVCNILYVLTDMFLSLVFSYWCSLLFLFVDGFFTISGKHWLWDREWSSGNPRRDSTPW